MASVELATAYISLVPTMKGAQGSIARELGAVDADGIGKGIGGKMGGGIAGTLKGLVGPAIAAAAAVGLGSYIAEAAAASDATDKFKSTMNFAGIDTSGIEAATKAAKAYADQTVYDLPTIQATMAQLASNGVSGYTELTEAAGNLNAVAGGNAETFKSVSRTLTQSAGAGKLMTEDWNMLADAIPGAAGPLKTALQDAGAYTGNFKEAMEKGQITSEEFQASLLKLGMDPIAVEASRSVTTFEGAIGGLQATINSGLMGALDALKPAITGAINGVSAGLGAAFGWIGNAFTGLKDLLVDGDFTGALARAFGVEEDSPIVGYLFSIRDAVIDLKAPFAELKESFKMGDGAAGIADFFTSFISSTAGVRDGLISSIGDAIPAVINTIVGAAPAILTAAVQSFSSLVTALLDTVPKLVTALLGMLPEIIPVVLGMIPVLLGAGLQLFQGLVQAVMQSLPQIITALVEILPQIAASLVGMLPMIVEAGLGLFMGIVDSLVQLLPVLIGAVMNLLPSIISTILGMLPSIITAALDLFLGLVTGLLQAAPVIINGLLGMLPQLMSTLIGMLPQLIDAAVQLFTGIVRALPIILPQLIGAIMQIGPQLVSTLISMVPMLVGAGVSLIGGLISGASSMFGAVVGLFGGLMGRISGAIGNAGSALLQTGKDIIQGLIDGIGSMMGAIGRAVLSIVPEAIRGPFEDLLGIHSPSRVFRGYGVNIGQGLILGIGDMHSDIESAVNGMVTVPTAPAYGATTAAGDYRTSSGISRPGVNIGTVNVRDENEMVRILETRQMDSLAVYR